MKLSEAAKRIDCDIETIRDGEFDAVALLGLRRNENERHISFVLGSKYIETAKDEGVECLVCPREIADEVERVFDGGICVSDDPKTAFFMIHALCSESKEKKPTQIHPSVKVADTAVIEPYDVFIDEGSVIMDNTVIKEGTTIGKNSVIMEGTVIGTPAFYYYGDEDTRTIVKSSGGVLIGDNVGIHTNVSIEKGVIGGNTIIADNTIVDNCILIGHDSQIWDNCILAASATLGGWVTIGRNSFVGLSATFVPKVTVGENCTVSAGAIVTKDVPDNIQVSGNFAIEHTSFIANLKQITSK